MYSADQDQEELEDDLYQEDERDSEGSEVNSELEFHLYSQLHYSSNHGELADEEEEDSHQKGVLGKHTNKDNNLKDLKDRKPLSSSNDNVQEPPKKKKAEKQKKRKSEPKTQMFSSSHFEEVIVIDSSPDVISISENDTADDDVGICALKGQSSHLQQTSTPAQQETRKRKRTLVPVNLVSSCSDSDSEESESASESESSESSESSDSDGLENWMILGGGKHDGDQSISLNLEGEPESSTDAEKEEEEKEESWLVSSKDKEAQIYNKDKGSRLAVQRVSNRYYTGKNVQCRNCNRTGHLSKNCPDPKKLSPCFLCGTNGHMSSECPNKHCNNCGLPGHLYESCSERAYWHKQCHRCSMTGHFFDACPEIWRQYHITTKTGPPLKKQGKDTGQSPAYCYNCSQKGHFGHECTRQKMFKGVYPSTPFISYYDSVEDINCRQHRLKLKVKELRKNGYVPTPSQSPATPGPPKKKQKINQNKNNHKLHHTPHKTPNDHNPSPSHIFFNDKFRDSTPKAKRFKQQDGGGSVKPWKPKRPVPTSKDPHPPAQLILDEADDFPRGGGPEENGKKKKKRKHRKKHVPLSVPEGQVYPRPDQLCWTRNGWKHGSASKHQKEEKKKNWRKHPHRVANKKHDSQMYPTDENLFIIKQRKRRRSHRSV